MVRRALKAIVISGLMHVKQIYDRGDHSRILKISNKNFEFLPNLKEKNFFSQNFDKLHFASCGRKRSLISNHIKINVVAAGLNLVFGKNAIEFIEWQHWSCST